MQKEQIEEYIILINSYIKAYKEFDTKAQCELLTENIEFTNIYQGEVVESAKGLVEFALIDEHSKTMFKHREIKINNINLSSNTADLDVQFNVTLGVGTPEGLKAGDELSFKASINFVFDHNKISKVLLIS